MRENPWRQVSFDQFNRDSENICKLNVKLINIILICIKTRILILFNDYFWAIWKLAYFEIMFLSFLWFKVSARESDAPALRWLKHLPILDQFWRNLVLIRACTVSRRFCWLIEAMVHGLAAVTSTELNLNYYETMKILIFSA